MNRRKPTNTTGKPVSKRGRRGFVQTGGVLGVQIRQVSEKRGFSDTRILTHWVEIAGETTAKISRPVKVSYNRQGIGASLTLLCTGANAPMLQMQIPQIITRVNSCYGYSAINRIHITQTSPAGFAELGKKFEHAPKNKPLSAQKRMQLETDVSDVADDGLRQALARLGEKIMTKPNNP